MRSQGSPLTLGAEFSMDIGGTPSNSAEILILIYSCTGMAQCQYCTALEATVETATHTHIHTYTINPGVPNTQHLGTDTHN